MTELAIEISEEGLLTMIIDAYRGGLSDKVDRLVDEGQAERRAQKLQIDLLKNRLNTIAGFDNPQPAPWPMVLKDDTSEQVSAQWMQWARAYESNVTRTLDAIRRAASGTTGYNSDDVPF